MKKKIIGVVAAALLVGGSIGYAASSSLIGAKVTGLFTINQNGKKIADAVIINGSAYAPVRAISEATGTGLTVEGKTINMESKSEAISEGSTTVATQRELTDAEKEVLRKRLAAGESALVKYREVIAQTEAEIAAEKDPTKIKGLRDFIDDIKGRITAAELINADTHLQLGE